MATDQTFNEQKEEGCFATTHERKYYHAGNSFVKRSLRPREYMTHPRTGEVHTPRLGRERLLNEAAALNFVACNTTIPVPKLHACFEDDGAVYLVIEYIEGRGMDELEDREKLVVERELEQYLSRLHELRSKVVGGPSGIVVPPYRVQLESPVDKWRLGPSETDDYVFCHNDISQQNVIVCHDSLTIRGIIDWEYAGYWPESFERHFYKRLGPSIALEGEYDDAKDMLNFLVQNSAEADLSP